MLQLALLDKSMCITQSKLATSKWCDSSNDADFVPKVKRWWEKDMNREMETQIEGIGKRKMKGNKWNTQIHYYTQILYIWHTKMDRREREREYSLNNR